MTSPDRPDERRDPGADPDHDAWLHAALRHAPDAQAVPPPGVSDAILREARAATRPAATAGGPRAALGRWAQAWAWLARPPVAAGFAGVMVATVVGLMWWDRPIDLRQPPAASERPAPVTAAPPRADPVEVPPPATATAPARKAAPARPATPGPAETRAPTAPPAAPESFPAPAPAPATQSDAAAAPRDEAGAPPITLRRSAAADTGQDNRSAAAKSAADGAAAELVHRPAPWAAVQASIIAEPQRWHWQRNGLARPMSPALERWLAQVDAATLGRWRRSAENAPAPAGRVLRLFRDGAPVATLRFDADRVWFTPETHAATLPPGSTDRLLKDLDAATP